jgi:hypothetical protein
VLVNRGYLTRGPDPGDRRRISLALTGRGQVAAHPDHGHQHSAETYLYVRDADALYAEWTRPGIGGETRPVGLMGYRLREGSHIDPDGNLIRFGSPVADG